MDVLAKALMETPRRFSVRVITVRVSTVVRFGKTDFYYQPRECKENRSSLRAALLREGLPAEICARSPAPGPWCPYEYECEAVEKVLEEYYAERILTFAMGTHTTPTHTYSHVLFANDDVVKIIGQAFFNVPITRAAK
jgi:hypothetical protein